MKTIAARACVRAGGEFRRKGYAEDRVAIEDELRNALISNSPNPGVGRRNRDAIAAAGTSRESHGYNLVYPYNLYEIPMSQDDMANAAHGQHHFPFVPSPWNAWNGDINHNSPAIRIRTLPCWPVAESLFCWSWPSIVSSKSKDIQ